MFSDVGGHSQISSFGFGGTNGHMVFWGESLRETGEASDRILRRLMLMSPPEVRPVGRSPDEWDTDMPDVNAKPGDKFSIVIDQDDPLNVPLKWIKEEAAAEEEGDEDFYSITGTFNGWLEERPETNDIPGVYSAIVDVPQSGSFEFRFLKNGDQAKVIAPEVEKCTRKTSRILGPLPDLDTSWLVRGDPGSEIQVELFVRAGFKSVVWLKRDALT